MRQSSFSVMCANLNPPSTTGETTYISPGNSKLGDRGIRDAPVRERVCLIALRWFITFLPDTLPFELHLRPTRDFHGRILGRKTRAAASCLKTPLSMRKPF